MSEPFGHQTLRNRYRFEGELQLLSPLRLSSGRASDTTDAPLMRDKAARPYVPGSSLRGAIRSELERVLAGLGSAAGVTSCILFSPDDSQGACVTASKTKQKELQDEEKKGGDEAAAYLENCLCDLCKLFGSPHYASRLIFEDACPVPKAELQTTVRDGVGIDRDTGAASENVKFNYEVLEVGPKLKFALQVENLTETDRKLINLVLALLRQGIFVGGKRAAGLGRIQLCDAPVVTGFESPDELWSALQKGESPFHALAWSGGAGC
ncbi:MAG TPA: CRISPR-associated RAMP protein Csx7 [Thermoanaerobaculia bacterium]|nr:CRISPR-associated RAMP protein Csx7 [Thermoanaerobaculia bacterium]